MNTKALKEMAGDVQSLRLREVVNGWQIASAFVGDSTKKNGKSPVWFCWRLSDPNDITCRESKKSIMKFLA